jgi:phosphoribosyl 1,2-cyclic phosphate phosphodiesterase
LKPKRAILTNLHADLDYASLSKRLEGNIEVAYDGLIIETRA